MNFRLRAYRYKKQSLCRRNFMALNIFTDINKSIKTELSRKAIHLSSLWMPMLIFLADKKTALAVFAALLAIDLAVEYFSYKKVRWVRNSFERLFVRTLRGKEIKKDRFCPSGASYVLAAAVLCVLCFPKEAAVVAMTVMLVSDSCAAVFGKIWGTRRLRNRKSLEGTAAFFLSSIYVMLVLNPLFPVSYASVLASTGATICELFEDRLKLDDNLLIPLSVGVILVFL